MASHFLSHPFRLTLSTLKLTLATHLVFSHGFQVSPASGPSMLPTFTVDGDWLAVDMTARLGRRVGVGDLVLYKIPLDAHMIGVKRVVGMPGDYVSLGTPGEAGEEQMIQVS
jgi:inner membrane protease subunit 1